MKATKKEMLVLAILVALSLGSFVGCGGNGGNPPPPKPTVSISANPTTITLGDSTKLTWQSSNASSCSASGDWSGTKSTSGNETVKPTSAGDKNYGMSCSGDGGSVSASVKVTVQALTVNVSPASATVEEGHTQQFTATVQGTGDFSSAVNWSVNNVVGGDSTVGTISQAGLYAAPPTVPNSFTATIKATSVQDSSKSGSSTLNVVPQVAVIPVATFGGYSDYPMAVDSGNHIVVGNWGRSNDHAAYIASFDEQGNLLWTYPLPLRSDFTPALVGGVLAIPNQSAIYFVAQNGPIAGAALGAVTSAGEPLLDPSQHLIMPGAAMAGAGVNGMVFLNGRIYMALLTWTNEAWAVVADLTGAVLNQFLIRSGVVNVQSITVTTDHILASGDCYCSNGNWNVGTYVRMMQVDGTLVWEKTFDDSSGGYSVEDSTGDIYFGGVALPAPSEQYKFRIRKLDEQGNQVWESTWDGDNPGGNNSSGAYQLVALPSGAIVLMGYLQQYQSTDLNSFDLGALAVDSSGTVLWKLRRDFSGRDWFDHAALDGDGQLFACAIFQSWPPGQVVPVCGGPASCAAILKVVPP